MLNFKIYLGNLLVDVVKLLQVLLFVWLSFDNIFLHKQLLLEQLQTCLVVAFLLNLKLHRCRLAGLRLDFLLSICNLNHLVNTRPDPIFDAMHINVQLGFPHL